MVTFYYPGTGFSTLLLTLIINYGTVFAYDSSGSLDENEQLIIKFRTENHTTGLGAVLATPASCSLNQLGQDIEPESSVIIWAFEVKAPSLPPTDVQVRMMNLTTLRISWRPPPPDGVNGLLKGYQILVLGNETRFHRNITTTERAVSVTLLHLVPHMTYHVQVAAYTSVGMGKFYDTGFVSMDEPTLQRHMVMNRNLGIEPNQTATINTTIKPFEP